MSYWTDIGEYWHSLALKWTRKLVHFYSQLVPIFTNISSITLYNHKNFNRFYKEKLFYQIVSCKSCILFLNILNGYCMSVLLMFEDIWSSSSHHASQQCRGSHHSHQQRVGNSTTSFISKSFFLPFFKKIENWL